MKTTHDNNRESEQNSRRDGRRDRARKGTPKLALWTWYEHSHKSGTWKQHMTIDGWGRESRREGQRDGWRKDGGNPYTSPVNLIWTFPWVWSMKTTPDNNNVYVTAQKPVMSGGNILFHVRRLLPITVCTLSIIILIFLLFLHVISLMLHYL